MADTSVTPPVDNSTQGTVVTSPQPGNAPVTAVKTGGPTFWKNALRPKLPQSSSFQDRQEQLKFDVLFAGAAASGKWEEEWPVMTEADFTQFLTDVANIELGGHEPDGSHPRA